MTNSKQIEDIILKKETTALDRWKNGDTFGFIEIASDDITYFDPIVEKRVTGKKEFTDYFTSFNGSINFPKYVLNNSKVQVFGDAAVLTFNFTGYENDGKSDDWNATEVYRFLDGDWKLASSHWSYTKP